MSFHDRNNYKNKTYQEITKTAYLKRVSKAAEIKVDLVRIKREKNSVYTRNRKHQNERECKEIMYLQKLNKSIMNLT